MNRRIISNGFLLATRRNEYLAGSLCGALILDFFDYILSAREITWLKIDYKGIEIELNHQFSYNTITRNIKLLEQKKLLISQSFKYNQKQYTLNYDLINSVEVPTSPQIKVTSPHDGYTQIESTQNEGIDHPTVGTESPQNEQSILIYKIQNTSFNTEPEQKNKQTENGTNSSTLNSGVTELSDLISSEIKSINHDTTINQSSLTKTSRGLTMKPTDSGKDQLSPQVDFSDNQNNRSAIQKIDPYFGQKRNQGNFGDWIPDGPWLKTNDNGRRYLDHSFVEYRAKKFFVKQFGDDLPEAISKTIKYYRNDVERLAIDWEEYHQTALNVAANIQTYKKSTGQIKSADVQKLESIKTAFQLLPENLQTTDKQPEFKPTVAQTLEIKSLPSENEILETEKEKTMNLTYKGLEPIKSAREYAKTLQNIPLENGELPVTVEQRTEMMAAMRSFLGGKFGKSKQTSLVR